MNRFLRFLHLHPIMANESLEGKLIEIIQDMDQAISVLRNVSRWMEDSGKNPSKWWKLENLNSDFLSQYAKPEEFYVVLVDRKSAAAAIIQANQNSQDWSFIDKGKSTTAMYIHWLCVDRQFAGMGLPKIMVDFAEQQARDRNIKFLRVDTNADEMKLRSIYEKLGFHLVTIKKEDYRKTAFYQKDVR